MSLSLLSMCERMRRGVVVFRLDFSAVGFSVNRLLLSGSVVKALASRRSPLVRRFSRSSSQNRMSPTRFLTPVEGFPPTKICSSKSESGLCALCAWYVHLLRAITNAFVPGNYNPGIDLYVVVDTHVHPHQFRRKMEDATDALNFILVPEGAGVVGVLEAPRINRAIQGRSFHKGFRDRKHCHTTGSVLET